MEANKWTERISVFATAIGKTPEEVEKALAEVVGDPGDQALEVLSDESASPFEDLKTAFINAGLKIPVGVLRKNIQLLRGPKPEAEKTSQASATATGAMATAGMTTDILPPVPDDDSFLAMLKVGGELKVGKTEVLAAVKAALAARVNLFDLPDKLKVRMEQFAEQNDEPVGKSFFDLRNLVVERQYADVLSVLGIKGAFMSEARKNKFFSRVDDGLWDELYTFHQQLVGWQRNWMDNAGNPAILMTFLAANMGGGGAVPPGIMQPPETDTVRDQAEAVINKINKVFAGTGIPVARALAYDAQRIKEVLMDERLPASVGAANREQMLKMLGADVASDYVRMERNLVRYILAIMELPNVTSGQSEIAFLGAMLQLGNSIPWPKLMPKADASVSKKNKPY